MSGKSQWAGFALGLGSGLALGALLTSRVIPNPHTHEKAQRASTGPNRSLGNKSEYFVGIDLGGTTVGVGVVRGDGEIVAASETEIPGNRNSRSAHKICDLIADLVRTTLKLSVDGSGESGARQVDDIVGFGIGAPGLLDCENGIVKAIANFDWDDEVELTAELAKRLGVNPTKVHLENDANAALLAEMWVGAGTGKSNIVMLTLGTGVGGAILSGGRILRGSSGDAGELGHTILVPGGRLHGKTGVRGIFEGYASATAVVSRTLEKLQDAKDLDESGPLTKLLSQRELSCSDIFFHASPERGDLQDPIAVGIVNETAEYLGIGCINVCRNFDPEVVILTGGMTKSGMQLLSKVRAAYVSQHWNITKADPSRIVYASCGNSAGKLGAAAVAYLKEHGKFF